MSPQQAELPIFELDRMILTCFGKYRALMARDIAETVQRECRRKGTRITRDEIMNRLWEMIEVGGLSPLGPLAKWEYRELYPALLDY